MISDKLELIVQRYFPINLFMTFPERSVNSGMCYWKFTGRNFWLQIPANDPGHTNCATGQHVQFYIFADRRLGMLN